MQMNRSARAYATTPEIAECAALTAAHWIDKADWIDALIELQLAARICCERLQAERQQPIHIP